MSNNINGRNMRQLFGNANNAANAPAAAVAAANVAVNAANVAVNAAVGTTARVNVNGKKFNAVITPVGGNRRRNKTNCGNRRRNKTNGGKRKSVHRKRKGTRRNKRN